jgi:membrane protein YdbS with pleckstrin-like domain
MHTWKKRFVILILFAFAVTVLIYSQIHRDNPAAHAPGFIFIFFAYAVFFPLLIAHERPRLSRWVYPFDRRPPPCNR